jgi:hypothetical protein
MDIYWNAIATPLLIFVIVNGILALFRMAGLQRASSLSIMGGLASLKTAPAAEPVSGTAAAAIAARRALKAPPAPI